MSKRDLTILGTSSQHPTRTRNHGAYLFRFLNEGFLFDPGEGTQRQFIFANVPPTAVTRIFITHFHGDHCLGLGSMLMRLNLDKVEKVHCYYPASGKKYFDRLRFGTIYHEVIEVIERPIEESGIVEEEENFTIEAHFLSHGVDNLGYRIQEKDEVKFYKEKLKEAKIFGPDIKKLQREGFLETEQGRILLEDVSYIRKGDAISVLIDTKPCENALKVAKDARILLAESTYLESEAHLADAHFHLTAKQAAQIAKDAGAKELVLTHFSARYRDSEDFVREAGKVFKPVHAANDFDVYPFPKRKEPL
jgi:ribonuclease Z